MVPSRFVNTPGAPALQVAVSLVVHSVGLHEILLPVRRDNRIAARALRGSAPRSVTAGHQLVRPFQSRAGSRSWTLYGISTTTTVAGIAITAECVALVRRRLCIAAVAAW